MYAAELVDVSTETLTKSMAKQIKSMKAVQDGTKLSVEAYDKLGVSVMNADGSLRDSDTVYWEVIDALGKIENETERDALAMQILGKSAQELAGQKRVTKESFEKWYLSQSRYVKVIERAETAPSAPEALTDTEPEKAEFSEKAFYKIEEVQSILNISKKAMYKLIQDGNLFAVRVGKNYVIPNGEVTRITGGR